MRDDTIRTLRDLAQLDLDCSLAYGQALDRLEPELRDQLTRFRQDHEHHLAAISSLLRRQGEEPPRRCRDLRGVILEAVASVGGMAGSRGALKAMRASERISRQKYQEAREREMPQEVLTLLETHAADETMHLNWIEQVLRNHERA